ncbi:uncharacterized protein I303_107227 [Kwoniella dejecticola CBS 10117]|uniref:Scytalone dehydratase-like protein Arp1 N-terminal domain-containing protein n=1 Tax=Kwoniella dejecticola CBS 10117 TaxID=1296121 RepID=A0A1A5ZZ37_9TREE|nr:uncharacterized protein I303_06628 [Kwoniella dejecticola CBS 10117]OBR83069.1 hypothetical protein I303_06628 [Kwoniella dejecticola CBS 10117]
MTQEKDWSLFEAYPNGRQYRVGQKDVDYYTHEEGENITMPSDGISRSFAQESITLLRPETSFEGKLTAQDLDAYITNCLTNDDVLNPGWLRNVAILPSPHTTSNEAGGIRIDEDALEMLKKKYGTTDIILDHALAFTLTSPFEARARDDAPVIHKASFSDHHKPGPYIVSTSNDQNGQGQLDLQQAYRAYSDTNEAFSIATLPSKKQPGSHTP